MFQSPKRTAWVTMLGGSGFGVLLTILTRDPTWALTLVLGLCSGMLLGGVVWILWLKSKAPKAFISWFLIVYFAVPVATVLGVGAAAAIAAGGFGLILWAGMHSWEKCHKDRVLWDGLESDREGDNPEAEIVN